jgi:HSP20 family protein
LTIQLDIPGADPDSIDLTVEGGVLTVRATRTEASVRGDQVRIRERVYGHFTRQLLLGDGLNRHEIAADYHDGVLTITIPVSEDARARKIPIAQAEAAVPVMAAAAH